ncbi:MAG: c-type cytochrome biogenesis protein CcmI [Silicimonas sp.]|nr:c-type cytochrome biogenesis protein CcmI [Silicimonas sp.]
MSPMIFWITAPLLALCIAGILYIGLTRASGDGLTGAESDMAVYRDQLDEIARDLERGVLGPEEAETARIEVSRRLLEADRRLSEGGGPRAGGQLLALLLIPSALFLGGGALYATIGAPGTRDAPIEARLAQIEAARANRPDQLEAEKLALPNLPKPEEVDPEFLTLMEQLRNALVERPNDVAGLQLLVRNEARLGNYTAAREAQERLLAARGNAVGLNDLAETIEVMTTAAGGYISPQAETHLNHLLTRDRDNPFGRYFLGLLQLQSGRPDLTFPIWRGLYAESPASAPWMPVLEAELPAIASAAGARFTLPEKSGPTAEDIAAASDMSAEDRQAMVENMVEGLAARLGSEGGPPEDWARLVGALNVLGQTERARAIYGEARQVWADNENAMAILKRAGVEAGFEE